MNSRTIIALLFALAFNSVLPAQVLRESPSDLEEVGFENRIGSAIPLETRFGDATGKQFPLSRYFGNGKPVVLAFHYTNCPMLCHLQLEGLVDGLREIEMTVGKQFDVVAISIDHNESPETTAKTRQRHIASYGRSQSSSGWHFLTGSQQAISSVTDAVGFQFNLLPDGDEFAHPAGIILCTSNGLVSRYLFGVRYEQKDLQMAVLEAGKGQFSSAFDQLMMFCFHYDETAGKYSLRVMRLTQIVCVVTLLILTLGSLPFWLRGTA